MENVFKCEFCEKTFSANSSLNLHTKTAAFCLKMRGENIPNMSCQYCGHQFTRTNNLETHLKTCKTKPKKIVEETKDELEKLKRQEKILKRINLKNKTIISEQNQTIENLKSVIGFLEDEKNNGILAAKKLTIQFEQDEKDYLERIFKLEKQVAFERGRLSEASKPGAINNCSTKNKIMSISIDNITSFTVETIKRNLRNYTYDDYVMGVRGIVKFLKSMILLTNENGELERNYVCTDASRNTYYRLDEIKKWRVDKGGLFIEKMVDEMILCTSKYFDQVKDKARDITDIYTEYNNKILEKLKPIQHGFLHPDSEERAILLSNIRTGIKSCASL